MVVAQAEGVQALGNTNSTAPIAYPAATATSTNLASTPGLPNLPSYGQPIPSSAPLPDHENNGNQQYGSNPYPTYPTIPSENPPYGASQTPPDYPLGKGGSLPGGISGEPPPVGGPPTQYVTSQLVESSQRAYSPVELFLLILLAIFIPPVAVVIKYACNYQFWICLLLTLLGHIPGALYALIVICFDL